MDTTIPTLTPYDYQLEAVQTTLTRYLAGGRRGVWGIPTGGGKTIMMLLLALAFVPRWRYILIIVPIIDLVDQTRASFLRFADTYTRGEIGRIQGDINELGRHITIATAQTLMRPERLQAYLDSLGGEKPSLIVYDEADLAIAKRNMALVEALMGPETLLIGPTATPYRADRQSLKKLFWDDLWVYKDIWDLIRDGYLVRIEGHDVDTDLNLSQFQVDGEVVIPEEGGKEEDEESSSPLVSSLLKSNRYEQAYANWLKWAPQKRTLVFAQSVKDAFAFEEYFTGKGVTAVTITGKTRKGRREEYYEQFKSGELTVLCNYGVLTTGNDLPCIECLIMGRVTSNLRVFTQSLGRGLRRDDSLGKEKVVVLNLGDQHHTLVMFDQLFGSMDDPEQGYGIKRVPKEEEEKDTSLLSLVPPSVIAQARETRSTEYNPLIGDGWNADTVTGNWSKQWGKYTVTAERVMGNRYLPVLFDGQRHFTLSEGKRTVTQLDAQVLCQRELAKKQQIERLRQGEGPQAHIPISDREFDILRRRRIILRTAEKDIPNAGVMTVQDYARVKAAMTKGDFYRLNEMLTQNGGNYNPDTRTLVGYVEGQGPQIRQGKWASGT